ncbi:MAG TPA: ABC transporter permease [Mycobacteriales bacterium]|nr:ABC transporter permease [Mycobacteriales bacterium]
MSLPSAGAEPPELAVEAEPTEREGAVAGRSPWQIAWLRLRRDRVALAGGVVVLLYLVVAAAAPLIARIEGQSPYKYHTDLLDAQNAGLPSGALGGISASHWFGVEPLTGRDLFAIVVYGARTSFLIGIAATFLAVILGVIVGMVSAYFSGWVDTLISRFMDVLFGFPGLIFMIALGIVAPPSFPRPLLLILVIGFFGFPYFGRVIRGQSLSLVEREFIDAARLLGAGPGHIVFKQLLPNLIAPIIVFTTLSIPGTIGTEAALSFLGVGIPAPTPDWGRTIFTAVSWFQSDLMYLLFPGGALFVAVLAFNVFGDGLRDALDPRSRR